MTWPNIWPAIAEALGIPEGTVRSRLNRARRILKETIDRWLWPDIFRGQDTSVAKAKQAIADYKKAVADSAGVADKT